MKRKIISLFILACLFSQCCVAYAIDTEEGEIIICADSLSRITRNYRRKELEACTKLRLINAGYENNTFAVENLMCMPNIEELYVADDVCLDDYSKLKAFQNLRVLSIHNQNISDISFVTYLAKLEKIDFRHNLIQNIDPIGELEHLRIINLSYNNISDISALKNSADLELLNLDYNGNISDLSAISLLSKMESLSISETNINDLSPISNLTNMDFLCFDGCNVEDITPISGLTKLTYLDMRYNSISDIAPLSEMHELEFLYLAGNPITDYSVLDLLHISLESAMDEP